MSYEMPVQNISLVAGADLSAATWKAAKLNTSGQAILAAASTDNIIGVITDPAASGRPVSVMTEGVTRAIYGGTVAVGDKLTADSNGALIKSTTRGDSIVGIALEAGAASSVGTVLLGLGNSMSGNDLKTITIPIQLAAITGALTVASFVPGFAGKVIGAQFVVTTPASTAAKAASLNLANGATDLTGGVMALTTANCSQGAKVAGTAITAGNTFSSTDTINIKSTGVTAFTEGQGAILILIAQTA